MRNYYDTLDVAPTATADEVTRAFRREIARYHPDKVEHLGHEFRAIAASKTAELTEAYETLADRSLRAAYDAKLKSGTPERSSGDTAPPRPDPAAIRRSELARDRTGASDLVRRATVMRFRQALNEAFGPCDEAPLQGFDVICAPPKGGLFNRSVQPRILGRCVGRVDAGAIAESWALASRAKRDDQRDLCVFVMGPDVAPAGELGRAIADERRRPMPAGSRLVIVPVNTRTWSAHIPTDAPQAVKVLLARLQGG